MRKIVSILIAFFALAGSAIAQTRVTGTVSDEKGTPVVGANVVAAGSTRGTVTNSSGAFTLQVAATVKNIVISAINYIPQTVAVSSSPLTVILKLDDKTLNEVVITGYTVKKKSEFTGATSKVASKQIEQVPIASFEQILQGRAPGLYIASGSGQPGSSARVNIRGVGSISGGNDPLYVLDGIPIEANVFRTLNPNDFETVDVLKDAAGAGQYGSRGANGVIVITTKRGKSGKTQIQYRGQVGVNRAPSQNNLRLMSTAERLDYEENLLGGPAGILGTSGSTGYPGWDYSPKNPRYASLSPAQKVLEAGWLDSIRNINTDWADIFFRNAKFSQQEINASGGSQGFNFFTSLSYYKQEGVIVRSDLDRYTFRANLDFKQGRLTASVRSSAGYSVLSGIESEAGVALANPVAAAYLELPYRTPYTSTGKNNVGTGQIGANALDRLQTTTSLTNQFKGDLAITAQLDIWNGIGVKTTSGVDWRNNNTSRFIDPNSYAGTLVVPGAAGSYNEGNAENLQLFTTTGLVYNKTIRQKHVINAQAMVEAIRNRARSIGETGYGLNNRLFNTPAAITPGTTTNGLIPLVSGARTFTGLFSYFASGDYTYNKKYTLSGSIRRDAPSQVPEKNRNNIFWTAGGSWNFIMEKFMQNQKIFQEARLRASYGESGNVNGFNSNFGYISTYGASSYAGDPGIIPTSPGNTDYSLESQLMTNVGVDLTFWKRRARLTVDGYIKESRNLFADQGLSRTTGFRTLSTNAAKMKNTGLDFSLSVDAVNTKDLLVTVGVNGGLLKNRITSLGLLTEIPQGTGIIRVGLPFGTHFIPGFLGVDPQSGLPVYEDASGNPTTNFALAPNKANYGTYLPKFTGGATLDATYKGFSISALFTTAQGVKRFNNESFFYEGANSNTQYNKNVDMLKSWSKPGDMTSFQRINSARQFSSKDIRDASFVRFRNLQVGYTFTPKTSKHIRSVRVWGQGQNLYTWTKWQGFDPEESNNIATYEFPNPKSFTAGVDINF